MKHLKLFEGFLREINEGLEKHVMQVIDDKAPSLYSKVEWDNGMIVDDEQSAKKIVDVLNASKEFGHASYNKKKCEIEFGDFKESEDNFADMYDESHVPKEINEDSEKDRYANKIKDVDEVRPRMAPAPKTDGMMASQGSKYFDLYLQDEASYVCVDKYGYVKGIANWEWMINQSSGAMFAATAKIANEKYKMLRDLGLLEDYGKDYFKRSYYDLWKEWRETTKLKQKQAA